MNKKLSLDAFQESFPEQATAVKHGQEVLIEDAGRTVMKIVAVENRKRKVKFGLGAEQFKDFDWEAWDALDAEVLKLYKNPF
jgi:antitoxin (DNA-binding transcriptional repressor) of toxin-antitoxin stability system